MNIKRLLSVCALSLIACNNGSTIVDGGPCNYKDTSYPAKLIYLETHDSVRYNAWLELEAGINSSDKTDTVYSERLNGGPLYAEQITKDSIEVGKTYTFVVKQILSGSCTPRVTMVKFQKF